LRTVAAARRNLLVPCGAAILKFSERLKSIV
jgi:hypothetical protein